MLDPHSTRPGIRSVPPRTLESLTWCLVAVLAVVATIRLADGFERLVFAPRDGAVDLRLRFDETRAWFDGYWVSGAVYPPASQALLWPVVGWLPFPRVRILWAILSLGALAWFSFLCARECGLRSTAGKAACGFLPLASSATASAVGIGQIAPIFLPIVVTAVLWMSQGASRRADSQGAAVLLTIASLKPTLMAPFAWLVLLLPRSWRPALVAGSLYLALSLVAVAVHVTHRPARFQKPVRNPPSVAAKVGAEIAAKTRWATSREPPKTTGKTAYFGGYGNLQNLSERLGLVGIRNFILPFASLLACGAWLFRHRRTDPWILLGVCGIAARLGWYHRFYDDMLILLPAIALVRIAASIGARDGVDRPTARIAVILVAATLAHLLVPGTIGRNLKAWRSVAAVVIWCADLLFLATVASSFENDSEAPRPEVVATTGAS
ncbi:MAG: glycosyltransferase family 87 protein [Alphaproteobacteria bacterium]